MLVESRPLDNLRFEGIVNPRNKLKSERLQDGGSWDAVTEQIVQLRADLQYPCGSMLCDDLISNLRDQCFPIRWRNRRLLVDIVAALSLGLDSSTEDGAKFTSVPEQLHTSAAPSSDSAHSPLRSSYLDHPPP